MKQGAVQNALLDASAKSNALLSRDLVTIATNLNIPPLRQTVLHKNQTAVCLFRFNLEDSRLRMPIDGGKRFLSYMRRNNIVKLDEYLTLYLTSLL